MYSIRVPFTMTSGRRARCRNKAIRTPPLPFGARLGEMVSAYHWTGREWPVNATVSFVGDTIDVTNDPPRLPLVEGSMFDASETGGALELEDTESGDAAAESANTSASVGARIRNVEKRSGKECRNAERVRKGTCQPFFFGNYFYEMVGFFEGLFKGRAHR